MLWDVIITIIFLTWLLPCAYSAAPTAGTYFRARGRLLPLSGEARAQHCRKPVAVTDDSPFSLSGALHCIINIITLGLPWQRVAIDGARFYILRLRIGTYVDS